VKAYEVVVERILTLLEQGTVPWHRPWDPAVGAPRNIRGTVYRGINALVLGCQGYESPFWLTRRQVHQLGGRICRGERGTPVLLWKWIERPAGLESGSAETASYPLVRYYHVWNTGQLDGVAPPSQGSEAAPDRVIGGADQILARMPAAPTVRHDGGARACYRPSTDSVHLPPLEAFEDAEGYLATLYHELVHSTGHRSRLARESLTDWALFGDHAYSEEELVAEIGSAYLCAHVGIENRTIENAAAYIASWLRVLQDDRRMVLTAAQRAQKASDWILGRLVTGSDTCRR